MLARMRTILATLHSKYIHASLALPCLASYCADCGTEIELMEFTVHEPRETVLSLLREANPDVVAFSVYLWNRRETLELVDALAVAKPGLRIVLGGPEVSFDGPELFENHPGVTALVRGEGERPFHALLSSWARSDEPRGVPRLAWRDGGALHEGPDGPLLENLDDIPSPFAAGRVDLTRGFTYLETSRGCPYRCSFCLSARDERVRSFSLERIHSDLKLLMDREVPKIKLVDRTFNYHPERAREIFTFILAHNRTSHFHFEIGAHLLDDPTLALLATVPAGMFQFEIGVQSTFATTLEAVDRRVDLERLEAAVRRLRRTGNIHLHLDLVAGLPGDRLGHLLASVDRVAALAPHHLQIEPVKLIPGSPLREAAAELAIHFDPSPPYTVLATPELSFRDLGRVRTMSRLLDQTWNLGRLQDFLTAVAGTCGSFAAGALQLADALDGRGALRHPLSFRGFCEALRQACDDAFPGRPDLPERLARGYALAERVSSTAPPSLFDTDVTAEELVKVKERLDEERETSRGRSVKLQHFASLFHHLDEGGRRLHLFLYQTRSAEGMTVREIVL